MKTTDFRLFSEMGLSLLFMAAVPVLIKFTAANPVTIGIIRLTIASLLMGIVIAFRNKPFALNTRLLRPLIMIGIVFSFHWITYFYSIKMATASIAIMGASTYGIHLIFLGWIFLKNRPRIIDGVAVIVAITGVFIIVPEFSFKNNITAGLLLSIFSGFLFAILPVLHQKHQQIPGTIRSMGQYLFAIPLFLVFVQDIHFSLSQSDWLSLLYLGIFGTFLAHSFWVEVTTRLPTTLTSVLFYVVIPLTMVLSYFFLGEQITIQKISGAFLIISGNLLGIFSRIKKNVNTPDLD